MAHKGREKNEAPRDVEAFNRGLGLIFEKRNILPGKDAEWLILKRDPRRVASAYALALDYCRQAISRGNGGVVEAAREEGDRIAAQADAFLGNGEMQRRGGWEKLESARKQYLNVRGRGAVPAKKGREAGREIAPRKRARGNKLEGAKISRAEPGRKELEGEIEKLEKEIRETGGQYYSVVSQMERELEEFVEDETGLFTSREDVEESDEYRKLREGWKIKERAAWEKWGKAKTVGGRKIWELENKIEALYWTQEQRKKKIWGYVEETLDPGTAGQIGGMVYKLRELAGGGMSRRIVGCENQKERRELDRYLLSRLEESAKDLSTHRGLSNPISPHIRCASAEAIGMIRPNDEWVNRRLIAQLGKYEKSDIARGDIAIAIGRIVEKHRNAKIDSGGKLRDEATDVLLRIIAEGEEANSDNQFDINFKKRMFVGSLIALGKTAKGTGREREAIDALAKAAIGSPTPMVSIAAAASMAGIGGKYAKKKLEEVREEKGLPEVARILEIASAYENGNMETAHLRGTMGLGIMDPDADFSRLVPPGKIRVEMVFGAPSGK